MSVSCLPPELLIEVFTYLGCKDLLTTSLVCKVFYNAIRNSLELQYSIELAADDMIDGPRGPGTMTIAQRLELLLDRRMRWRTLDWTQEVKISLVGSCQAYELVGGVFAKSMGLHGMNGSRHLIATWLPSRSEGPRSITREDLGVPTRDFAIDPSQDLIALVDIEDSSTTNVRIRVHLRTISTNTPHKGAAKAELQSLVPFQIGSCFIQIIDDVVGMFFWLHGPGLIIWNWRTGETVVACLPHDIRPLATPAIIPHFGTGAELHPATWDFAPLSSRAYMLTTVGGRGSIEIYSYGDPRFEHLTAPNATAAAIAGAAAAALGQGGAGGASSASSALVPRPVHVASLLLPATRPGEELHHFSTHTSPSLGGDFTKGKPFAASQENRVHLMSFHYGVQGPRYHLFVKNDFLHGFVTKFTGQRQTLRWEDWGPDNTRFLEHNLQFQWLRYVHGQRIVLPPFPHSSSSWPNAVSRLCVIDFNVHPKRLNDPCKVKQNSEEESAVATYEVVDQESFISAGPIFENDVVSRLPYAVASKTGQFNYSGFMIDEDRLVGMKLSMAFAEGVPSDIDVFTF